jgi:hypothetical protein
MVCVWGNLSALWVGFVDSINMLRGDLGAVWAMVHNKGDLRCAYRMTYCTKVDKKEQPGVSEG